MIMLFKFLIIIKLLPQRNQIQPFSYQLSISFIVIIYWIFTYMCSVCRCRCRHIPRHFHRLLRWYLHKHLRWHLRWHLLRYLRRHLNHSSQYTSRYLSNTKSLWNEVRPCSKKYYRWSLWTHHAVQLNTFSNRLDYYVTSSPAVVINRRGSHVDICKIRDFDLQGSINLSPLHDGPVLRVYWSINT